MEVIENTMDEIFAERALYLVNVDNMMFEMYDEQISIPTDIREEKPLCPGFGTIDMTPTIKLVDRLFTSKEYQTYIELTRPEQISKHKFEPMSLKKLKADEFEELSPENNDQI